MTFGEVVNKIMVRFTPYDLSGYTFDWLNRYDKFICAREDLDDNLQPLLHYHLYIETDAHPDTVRDMVKARLRIPPAGRGKNNKYYAMFEDWKDPGYVCKYNQIQSSKGYSEAEVLELVKKGKIKYLDKVEKTPAGHSVTAEKSSTTPKSPRIPYQQQIIAIASAEWYKYKRECKEQGFEPDKYQIIEYVCKAMRDVSRGVNEYLVRDICNAVLFDDLDYRDRVLQRLKSRIEL